MKDLHNAVFAVISLVIFFFSLEIIQRYRHPHVGCRGMYNSLGFRSQEFKVRKEPGVTRILFAGSSTTFGINNTLENTFPFLVGQVLNKKAESIRVETINTAVPGVGSFGVAKRIEESLYLNPDIIIVMTGYNDSATIDDDSVKFGKGGELIVRRPWYVSLSIFLTRHSVFYVTLREKIAILLLGNPRFAFSRQAVKPIENRPINAGWLTYYPQYYRNNLERIVNIADRYNIKLIFLNPPLSALRKNGNHVYARKFYRLKEELLKVCADFNIAVIGLEEQLSESKLGEYISTDGIHFTDKGNLRIAEIISGFLLQNRKEYLSP